MAQNSGERRDGDGDVGGGSGGKVDGVIVAGPSFFNALPEDCISTIISFTSPLDASVATAVSRIFRSAAQSDIVWERFLPPDYLSLVPESRIFLSKKELYLFLSDEPVLIDNGRKSVWLEKSSGKKCCMLSARDITIIWGSTPQYWQWISLPGLSRFQEVAELRSVWWLEIRGKMKTCMLSPGTRYAAYIVFRLTDECYGFENLPVDAGVGAVGSEVSRRLICFEVGKLGDSFTDDLPYYRTRVTEGEFVVEPKERKDGWMEVELGEFFNSGGLDGDEIEMSALETKGQWKTGLIIQGIEIRPKEDK